MPNVKYTGYFSSNSGMAEAARNIVMGFHSAGAGVTTEIAANIETTKHLGPAYEFCQHQAGVNIPYTTKIIHITPDGTRQFIETMKYHIFHLFWETSKLPKWWVWELQHSVDEIWTGCEWNKQVFQESGITLPIHVIPQPVTPVNLSAQPFTFPNKPAFLFGSVFQWIERKNPEALIKSFLEEFRDNKEIGLLIKSYKERHTDQEIREITEQIKIWKHELHIGDYPKIFLYPIPLEKEDMSRFYKTIDCFVSTHRGEGWGLPIVEAMTAGLPVISTNLGGCHEHIPREFWYPLEYDMCHVFNMGWIPWYDESQEWGNVKKEAVRSAMRSVINHEVTAKEKGQLAQEWVKKYFSYEAVGKQMISHIKE